MKTDHVHNHQHYTFIDYATQIYLVVVAIIILVFSHKIEHWWAYFAGHIVIASLIHLLIRAYRRRPGNRILTFLRYIYPVILYTAMYRETGELNHILIDGYLDPFFISLEQSIFGLQPAIELMKHFPQTVISELLYASYFSYYVMIVGIGLVLYFQNKDRCFHYVTAVSFVFYVCYFTYILVPAIGGRTFWAPIEGLPQGDIASYPVAFPASVTRGFFYKIMGFIYRHFEAEGAAFPSSHIAVALTTLYFSWQHLRRIRYIHAVFVVLLIISTVYCRYHYLIDVYAGVLTFAILVFIVEIIYPKIQKHNHHDQQL